MAYDSDLATNKLALRCDGIPNRQELGKLIELFNLGQFNEVENLAKPLTDNFPTHGFCWHALGASLNQMGRYKDALAPLLNAVKLLPFDSDVHNNLGITLRNLGRLDEAEASCLKALEIKPDHPGAFNTLGNILKDLCLLKDAEACFSRALKIKPNYPEAYNNLGNVLRDLGRFSEAEASYRQALQIKSDYVEAHSNLARTLSDLGRLDEAEEQYRSALEIKPDFVTAYLNLAALHSQAGRVNEAESCRDNAFHIQRVFLEGPSEASCRVLILCVGRTSSGNVPVEELFSDKSYCRIKYHIDYADDKEDMNLPPFDLVFNAVGDPDVAEPVVERLERFSIRCNRPLLNSPSMVNQTHRHQIASLLSDIEGVLVAPCIRLETLHIFCADLTERLASAGIEFPIIVRPIATHGGEGMILCESIDSLERYLHDATGPYYLTSYYDYRNPDGYYRKYRIIFVDREPFPYHLAISPKWLVHYFSSDMEENLWKIEEERRFLLDPHTVLGTKAVAAIATIGHRLDLDYGGVDFTLFPDGQVLVFEANATMLVHYEKEVGLLAHKNIHVQNIIDSFEVLLSHRAKT